MKNKKVKNFLIFIYLICAKHSFSQAYTILPGEEKVYSKEEGLIFKDYLEADDKAVYINRGASDEKAVQINRVVPHEKETTEIINKIGLYDISNTSGQTAVINRIKKKDQMSEETILQKTIYNNKVLAICKRIHLKEKKIDLYLKYIEFDGLEKENRSQLLLASINDTDNKDVFYKFKAFFSPDKSKIFIKQTIYTYKKATYSWIVNGWIFETSNAKKLSEFSVPRFQDKLELEVDDIFISNNGNVFCPSRIPKDTSTEIERISTPNTPKSPLSPIIFYLNLNQNSFKSIKLSDLPINFQDFKLKEVNESVYAYGSLFNKSNKSFEIFYAKMDIKSEKITEFSSVRLTPAISSKLKVTPLSILRSDKLILDGENVFVICQNTYVHSYSGTGGIFHEILDRDLIIGKFNKENTNQQINLIPKNTGPLLKNYHVYTKKGALYVVYVEHPKNLEDYTLENYDPEKYNMIVNYNGSVSVCTKISTDGTMKRETLFENKGWCFKPENLDIVIEKENALILHMIKGKKERFDKLIIR